MHSMPKKSGRVLIIVLGLFEQCSWVVLVKHTWKEPKPVHIYIVSWVNNPIFKAIASDKIWAGTPIYWLQVSKRDIQVAQVHSVYCWLRILK